MAIDSAPADSSPEAGKAAPAITSPAPPSWPWRRVALFLAGAVQLITISARLEPDGTVLAARGLWDVAKAGPPGEEIELRVFGNSQYYGRFMMGPKPGSRPSLQARLVAVTLADQAGRALAAGTPASSNR
jgi:hypothetical protein